MTTSDKTKQQTIVQIATLLNDHGFDIFQCREVLSEVLDYWLPETSLNKQTSAQTKISSTQEITMSAKTKVQALTQSMKEAIANHEAAALKAGAPSGYTTAEKIEAIELLTAQLISPTARSAWQGYKDMLADMDNDPERLEMQLTLVNQLG